MIKRKLKKENKEWNYIQEIMHELNNRDFIKIVKAQLLIIKSTWNLMLIKEYILF